jgi:hypothetical protein
VAASIMNAVELADMWHRQVRCGLRNSGKADAFGINGRCTLRGDSQLLTRAMRTAAQYTAGTVSL